MDWIGARSGPVIARAFLGIMIVLLSGSSGYAATHGILAARFHWLRADIQVFLTAHRQADLCALGVKSLPKFATGGYTFLNRNVPLYLWDFASPDYNPGSNIPLRLAVIFRHHTLVQDRVASFRAIRLATTTWLQRRKRANRAFQRSHATLTRSTPSCRLRSACFDAPVYAIEVFR